MESKFIRGTVIVKEVIRIMYRNTASSINYSSITSRVMAAFLDLIVIILLNTCISSLIIIFIVEILLTHIDFQYVIIINSITIFAIYLIYFVLGESSKRQATIGKWIFKIKVSNFHGSRISLNTALLRTIIKMLLTFGCLGFPMVYFSSKKQAFHDYLAKTIVINSGERG